MRPIYECPDNNVSAKLADDCARISTLHITIRQLNYFRSILSNVITAPNSNLNVTDGQSINQSNQTIYIAQGHNVSNAL